jgi:hypothetical protein
MKDVVGILYYDPEAGAIQQMSRVGRQRLLYASVRQILLWPQPLCHPVIGPVGASAKVCRVFAGSCNENMSARSLKLKQSSLVARKRACLESDANPSWSSATAKG